MPTLDKLGGNRIKQKSKCITIDMPANNNAVKTAIDAELDNGWNVATSIYDSTREKWRIVFTKPKRNP